MNNPCPSGYRLPTYPELIDEYVSWSSNTSAAAYASPLKLPTGGTRQGNSGSIGSVGSSSNYWSGTANGTSAGAINFYNVWGSVGSWPRGNGFSVRCMKN